MSKQYYTPGRAGLEWRRAMQELAGNLTLPIDEEVLTDEAWTLVPEEPVQVWRVYAAIGGWKWDAEVAAIVGNEDDTTLRARVALAINAEGFLRSFVEERQQ